MPWNQPGGDNKDPWSGGGRNNQGPPDLDEMLKNLRKKIPGFGGGSGGGNGAGISGILLLGLIVWAASGFYIVDEGNRGIVIRFGKFQSISSPGPHWHLPAPIEKVEQVDMETVRSSQHRASMLTQDENIVDLELSVQYRIKDPVNYLFQVRFPDNTLQQSVESALREVVGKQKMDFVLNEGRSQIGPSTKELTQKILDSYDSGLELTTVNLQQSQPPEMVQDAFLDAIKAREDNVRFINEAEAYSNGVLPLARGEAARAVEEAKAYKAQIIARAEGDASRFSQLLTEYKKAPAVTRERLYLEAVEDVLGNTGKVIVDTKNANSMMYLPLDKMLESRTSAPMKVSPDQVNQRMQSPDNRSSSTVRTTRSGRPSGRPTREVR
ncbi:MAG: FtsH protease activity modulator HflK [bacterium]